MTVYKTIQILMVAQVFTNPWLALGLIAADHDFKTAAQLTAVSVVIGFIGLMLPR